MRQTLFRATAVVMLLVFPCAMMAGEMGAMVLPSGSVALNGNAVTRPTAVFAGDQIQTADGSVSMTLLGGNVQISPKSSMMYAPGTVTLGQGAMRVVTSSGVTGRVLNLTVHPASSGAVKYEVDLRGGKVLVAALQGTLRINDGSRTVMLEAGKAISMPVPQPEAAASSQGCPTGQHQVIVGGVIKCVENTPGGSGQGTGQGAPAGAGGGGVALSGAQIAAIAVGAAAAAAGIGYGISSALGSPASPVR